MSHHSEEPFGEPFERPEIMRKLLNSAADFRGAIGAYPHGKLTASDEGSIQFAVGVKDGKVVLDFGTSVQWIGMTAQDAADLASTLLSKAREAGRQNGEVVHMKIGG